MRQGLIAALRPEATTHPSHVDRGKLIKRLLLTFSEPVDQRQWPAEPASWDELPIQAAIGRIDDDPRYSVRQPEPVSVLVEGAKVTIELSQGEGTVEFASKAGLDAVVK